MNTKLISSVSALFILHVWATFAFAQKFMLSTLKDSGLKLTAGTPLHLLCLIGLTVFASPLTAQVFDPGPSDPALFDTVINVPSDPDLAGDYVVPPGFQINLFHGGNIGPGLQPLSGSEVNISGGTVDDFLIANAGSEVNISGGFFGDSFKALPGSVINIRGTYFELDGDPLFEILTTDEAFTITDRDVTLTGSFTDGSNFSFELNSNPGSPNSAGTLPAGDFFSAGATLTVTLVPEPVLLGDVNHSGYLDFLDIAPFIEVLMTVNSQIPTNPRFSVEAADVNLDGKVDFLDVYPFIKLFR